MRWAFRIVGVVIVVLGALWVLQGIGVAPGSFMTGQIFWAGAGLVALLAGACLLFLGFRPR